jgi:hypothetical protein
MTDETTRRNQQDHSPDDHLLPQASPARGGRFNCPRVTGQYVVATLCLMVLSASQTSATHPMDARTMAAPNVMARSFR